MASFLPAWFRHPSSQIELGFVSVPVWILKNAKELAGKSRQAGGSQLPLTCEKHSPDSGSVDNKCHKPQIIVIDHKIPRTMMVGLQTLHSTALQAQICMYTKGGGGHFTRTPGAGQGP